MPAVVRHSERWPYMTMSRFETGPNGNPHYHGFSVGVRGPVMQRVKDDDGGREDMPPKTVSADVQLFKKCLQDIMETSSWKYEEERSTEDVLAWASLALRSAKDAEDSDVSCSEASDRDEASDHAGDEFAGRVRALLEELVEAGCLETVRGESDGGAGVRGYRLLRPRVESYEDHDLGEVHVSNVRERELVDLSIMKPGNEGVKMRSV